MHTLPQSSLGTAKRHADWDEITKLSSIGRATLDTIPNYRLLKAATRTEASPAARLLLVHLIGYLGVDQTDNPASRFIVFPGNTRLADELHYSKRSIQRLADELENAGLLRRCYNGLNRRTGFDLTPLAMRHETIEASIVAIHTQRRVEREQLQLELSLTADRIERPSTATNESSQGDNPDTQNRPTHQDQAESALLSILDKVDPSLTDKLCGSNEANQEENGSKEANVLSRLTGSGRAAHIGWELAKKSFGFDRAVALCAIAHEDPKRKASPERYFGWLVRMAMTNDGHAIIAQALGRIEKKAKAPVPVPVVAEVEAIEARDTEEAGVTPFRQRLFDEVGAKSYHSWMRNISIGIHGANIHICAETEFTARYVEDHFGQAIRTAARQALGRPAEKVEFDVA